MSNAYAKTPSPHLPEKQNNFPPVTVLGQGLGKDRLATAEGAMDDVGALQHRGEYHY